MSIGSECSSQLAPLKDGTIVNHRYPLSGWGLRGTNIVTTDMMTIRLEGLCFCFVS